MADELKPCPFCGGAAVCGLTRIWCEHCNASVEQSLAVWTEEGLAAIWNRRPKGVATTDRGSREGVPASAGEPTKPHPRAEGPAPPQTPAGQTDALDDRWAAAQVTVGLGLVDIGPIQFEGRRGVLIRARDRHIPVGDPGDLQAGEYWPTSNDVVIWIDGEGPAVLIKELAALAAPPEGEVGEALGEIIERIENVRHALDRKTLDGIADDLANIETALEALSRQAATTPVGEKIDLLHVVTNAMFQFDRRTHVELAKRIASDIRAALSSTQPPGGET